MGAGRKTSTYDVDTRASAQYSYEQFQARQRNLGDKLGGCIFGCTNDTMEECVTDLVFGLPKSHWCYVQWISKGMPIFLFNYSDRKLHGIYRAVTDGEWEIKPEGWCRSAGSRTMYPSQVQVGVYSKCEPLMEREYKPILSASYAEDGHLLFELKKTEAQQLCKAFDAKTSSIRGKAGSIGTARPMPSATGATSGAAKQQATATAAANGVKSSAPAATGSKDLSRASSAASDASGKKATPSAPVKQEDFPSLPAANPAWRPAAPAKPAPKAGPQKEATSKPAASRAASSQPASASMSKSTAQPAHNAQAAAKAQPAAQSSSAPRPSPASQAPHAPAPQPMPAAAPPQPNAQPAAEPAMDEEDAWDEDGTSSSQWNNMDSENQAGSWHPAGPSVTPPAHPSSLVQTQGNGHMQAAEASGSGTADGDKNDDLYELLTRMHAALGNAASGTAGAIFLEAFTSIKSKLDQARSDRILLAAAADQIKREKQVVEAVVSEQSTAIEVLKDECAALRRDLAFVGKHININVADVNPLVASLPPLHAISGSSGAASGSNMASSSGVTADSILLFGGTNGKMPVMKSLMRTIAIYTPSTGTFTDLNDMPLERVAAAATAVGSSVYLMGGYTILQDEGGSARTDFLEGCLRYDIPTCEWFEMNPMSEKRGSLAAASLHGKVYAIGGGKRSEGIDLVEVLDPEVNIWLPAKRLKFPRFATSAGVVGESIYTVGGFDSTERAYLRSMERMDPREGFWEQMPLMQNKRGGSSVVTVHHDLYVLGGYSEAFLDNVEVFDTRKGAWREHRSMKTPHAYFAAGYIDGHIHALSGMEDAKVYNTSVERYNADVDRWQIVPVTMNFKEENGELRAFAAACQITV